MAQMTQLDDRYARPILLAASLLLISGAMLVLFHLLLLGWALYAAGHVLAMVAFVAIAVVYRDRMDAWAWLGLIVLEAGLAMGLLGIAEGLRVYSAPGGVAELRLPVDAVPLGLTAELVTWVGLAFFGLAARGGRALPRGIGWVFVAAAAIGILGDLRLISAHVWFLAVLLMAFGLLGVATSLRGAPGRATASA